MSPWIAYSHINMPRSSQVGFTFAEFHLPDEGRSLNHSTFVITSFSIHVHITSAAPALLILEFHSLHVKPKSAAPPNNIISQVEPLLQTCQTIKRVVMRYA